MINKQKIKLMCLLILSLLAFKAYSQVGAGDCPGLCVTTGNTYAAVNGTSQELNATNRGCLTANEASASFWFQVCFTSNGIFQFYINPAGNRNDFDFAVWNTTTCPPTTSPIRCSYAAVLPGGPCATCDYTGLGNGATDLTEGATGNGYVQNINVTSGQCLTININNYGSGSNLFSIFFTGTTATMNCPISTPLPINLHTFEAVYDSNVVKLNWSTTSEINNDYFVVEKFTTQEITQIANINGHDNSNTMQEYSFIDSKLEIGWNYYRLVQVDNDGVTKAYDWVSVLVTDFTDDCCTVYYDLVGNIVNIDMVPHGIYLGVTANGEIIKIKK